MKRGLMVRIRDPIHGVISLSELEKSLLDSPEVQRLRGIRQLATAYLVYPGANHTRFEHSLGTLFLADRICKEAQIEGEDAEKAKLAALLHDVGHVSFSHEAEEVLRGKIGDHESIGKDMILKSNIADLLSCQFSPKEIAKVFLSPLGTIISSDIGADRMDYLLRDSHYTGVAYGVIDAQRICTTVSFGSRGIFLLESGLEAAESLLIARATMFSTVYLHKTVRIASRMIQHAMAIALENEDLQPEDFLSFSDCQALNALLKSEKAREYALRILNRRLFKKAFSCPIKKIGGRKERLEEELSDKCGCTVLIDAQSPRTKTDIMLLKKDESKVSLSAESELVKAISKNQQKRFEAIVICEDKNVKKVSLEAKKILG